MKPIDQSSTQIDRADDRWHKRWFRPDRFALPITVRSNAIQNARGSLQSDADRCNPVRNETSVSIGATAFAHQRRLTSIRAGDTSRWAGRLNIDPEHRIESRRFLSLSALFAAADAAES